MDLDRQQEEALRAHFLRKRRESENRSNPVNSPETLRYDPAYKESFLAKSFANYKISPRHDEEIKKIRKLWPETVGALGKHTWPKHVDHHRLVVECVHPVYKQALYSRKGMVVEVLRQNGFNSLENLWIEQEQGTSHIYERALAEIQIKWEEIAFPLNKHSLPSDIKGPKLIVQVEHPTFAQTMQLVIPTILKNIHKMGYVHITKIFTNIGPIDWTPIHLAAEQNKAVPGQKNEPDDSDIPISAGAQDMLTGLRDLKNRD